MRNEPRVAQIENLHPGVWVFFERSGGTRAVRTRTWPRIPTGFRPKAQGCEARATLGNRRSRRQPQRGCASIPTCSQIRAQGFTNSRVSKKWTAVLGGDDEVKADDRQRLEQWFPVTLGRNPVGVVMLGVTLPRVARASQPWALGQNPFGISSRKCPNSRAQIENLRYGKSPAPRTRRFISTAQEFGESLGASVDPLVRS